MVNPRRGGWGKWGWGWLAALLLLACALTACSSGSDDDSAASIADRAAAAAPMVNAEAKSMADPAQADKAQDESGSAEALSAASSAAPGTDSEAGAGGSIGAIADPSAGYNRKMIYSATVELKAESFSKAEEKVSSAISQSKGFIVQFADTHNGDEVGSTYVIKVPSTNFSSFLALLKAIPNQGFDRQVQGNDVTEEYVDLEARLSAKQAVEARLLAFMDKATKSDDLVKFSNELGSVQQEIEQIKGRMHYLDQNVAYSTVNLRLYEVSGAEALNSKTKDAEHLGERMGGALVGSARVLARIGEGLLTIVAGLLPVLLVAAVIGLPTAWWIRKSRAAARIRAASRRLQLNAATAVPAPAAATASEGAAVPEEQEKRED